MFARRQILAAGAIGTAALFTPRIAFAKAPGERRLLFVIQRGAADGLATLAPLGEPAYARLRGELVRDLDGGTKLDGLFTLHPALKQIAGLYTGKQALFAHAVATPYRDRSHFDAQNVLETGGARPYDREDGWMNRLLALLPPGSGKGLAISATIPTALRGPVQVASYAPSALPDASPDLIERVSQLYGSDPQLHGLWEEALSTRAMAADSAQGRGAEATGKLIASLMAGPDSARIVLVESDGWDTHSGQRGRLNTQLGRLDAMIGAVKDGLGPAWADTLVIVATEFGRTAAANGTGGTDHGTGSLAMLLGGTVSGGQVVSDWPGLAQGQLHEGRDLRPTRGLDALIAGAVAPHFGIDPNLAAARLFPGGAGKALENLVRG